MCPNEKQQGTFNLTERLVHAWLRLTANLTTEKEKSQGLFTF
jgi:hypothetical protein